MTPEQIMAAFEERGPLPRAALRAAGASRDAMAPLFLDHIDRLLEVDVDVFDEDLAFIFVYHLLAEWRETRAYRPMARLLRRDPEFVDALMGDGITECVARVMASLFDGDLEPIVEAALDEDADQFVRGQMLDALVILALDRPPTRPAVGDFLRRFHAAAGETTPDVVWSAWAFAVAALGLADMTPLVRQLYDDGLIDPHNSTFADFERDLKETLATGRSQVVPLARQARRDHRHHRRALHLVLLLGSLARSRAEPGRDRRCRSLRRPAALRERRAEGRAQRSLSLRQRQEVQEVLPALSDFVATGKLQETYGKPTPVHACFAPRPGVS